MPPIPIYADRPINTGTTTAAKPSGTTPQTAATPEISPSQQQLPPPTKTTATSSNSTYSTDSPPPPQPGAVPVPPAAPTSSIPFSQSSNPPAPQPGPTPATAPAPTPAVTGPTSSFPRTGTATVIKTFTTTAGAGQPPQFGMEPVASGLAARHSTVPDAARMPHGQQGSRPMTLSYGPIAAGSDGGGSVPGSRDTGLDAQAQGENGSSLAHPPGYVQNADGAAAVGSPSVVAAQTAGDGGVWETAARWARQAGEKLVAVEEGVWRAVGEGKGR